MRVPNVQIKKYNVTSTSKASCVSPSSESSLLPLKVTNILSFVMISSKAYLSLYK